MVGRFIRRYLKYIALTLCMLAVLVLQLVHNGYVSHLDSQQLAKRWGERNKYTQVSCFFSQENGIPLSDIRNVEHGIGSALAEASLSREEGEGRNFVDAYSTRTTLTLQTGTAGVEVQGYAVSKDFFLFHPMELLYGHYFTQGDDTQDGIIVDENVAWRLFGARNVVGMPVDIGDTSYIIRGVVKAKEGYFSEDAGELEDRVYVDYGVLTNDLNSEEELGMMEELVIENYELLIERPVSNFGTATMEKVLEEMGYEKYQMVENTTRFGLEQRFQRLKNFGVRSMQSNQILYPYWENRARGYEDVSTLLLVVQLLFMIFPVIMAAKGIVVLWKNKKKIGHTIGNSAQKLYKDVNNYRKNRKNHVQ